MTSLKLFFVGLFLCFTVSVQAQKLGALVQTNVVQSTDTIPVTTDSGANTFKASIATIRGSNPTTVTQTNFVLNTVYTNGSQVVLIRATAALTAATVNGSAAMDLMADQAGGATFALLGRSEMTTTVALALNTTNVITGIVSPFGTYYWTNSSTGAGNSSLLVAGTGQQVTLSSGTNGVQGIAGPSGSGAAPTVVSYTSSTTIDFSGQPELWMVLGGNVTFSSSNLSAGKAIAYRIDNQAATNCLVILPATWRFVSGTTNNILATAKIGLLSVKSYAANDTNVVALWSSE